MKKRPFANLRLEVPASQGVVGMEASAMVGILPGRFRMYKKKKKTPQEIQEKRDKMVQNIRKCEKIVEKSHDKVMTTFAFIPAWSLHGCHQWIRGWNKLRSFSP